ncbi:MAG: hypothetical protein HOI74_11675 [Gammaproteobacteria bacterium]|nr:hypothetical protein [Gammaproteobacteria bacterium]MBT5724677.1 hypothetical protein [Gammaproteobacteria bacterium]
MKKLLGVQTATVAFYTKKSMLEYSASEVTTEFFMDKTWQRNLSIRKMGLE